MRIAKEHLITSRDQLRSIVGHAEDRFANKAIGRIDTICRRFIARSSYVVIATRGSDGLLDLSPKGDPAGFVEVLTPHLLLLPDRTGNGRFDSYENLFDNPELALLFVIPGHNATLRVAGEGKISQDPALTKRYAIAGNAPRFVLLVTVGEAFVHCSKSSIRANLWEPDAWPTTSGLPTVADITAAHNRLSGRKSKQQMSGTQSQVKPSPVKQN